jgi:hypothetical protein
MFSLIVVGQPSTQTSNYLFQNKFLNIYNNKIHDYDVSPDIQLEKINAHKAGTHSQSNSHIPIVISHIHCQQYHGSHDDSKCTCQNDPPNVFYWTSII